MSIAVRVSVWILGVLVVVSAAVAVLALMQKQSLQGQNQSLQGQVSDQQSKLSDLSTQTKNLQATIDDLNNKVSQAQQDKAQAQSLYDDLKKKSDDLQSQLDQANSDRDDWKNRVDTISRERDDLMRKLKDRPTRVVYKTRIVHVQAPVVSDNNTLPAPDATDTSSPQNEQYWASVLRQKAALQVALEKAKSDLDQAALQVVDLKKQNSDLQVQVQQVTNEKDDIVQKIKYGQDLADNLSIDLARSRNDQQAVNDRADKLKEQNSELLSQINGLSSAKLELEQTVSRLTDDKEAMQKKLIETESIIQSRIDDIWKIKQSLDKKLSENSSSGSMDLPPIIVNAPNSQQAAAVEASPAPAVAVAASTSGTKTEGSIISINDANNFVIVDLGQENSTVSVGTPLKVYNNSNQVADLEVIQVRRDICAADIKDKTGNLQVGEVVKFN